MSSEWVTYTRQKLMWLLDDAGDGHVAEVIFGKGPAPWKYRMRIVESVVPKGQSLSNGKWDEILYHAIRASGRAYILSQDGNFFLGVDPQDQLKQVGKVMDFEIVGRKVLSKKESRGKAINSGWKNSGIYFYRFGRLLTSDIYGLARYLYDDINPYTVGQAYSWNNRNEYTPRKFTGETKKFKVSDFIAAGNHYNSRGRVAGVAFLHNTVGVINGLEELKRFFPSATLTQVRELYKEFDLNPSTHIGELFKGDRPKKSRGAKSPVKGLRIPNPHQKLDEAVNPDKAKLWGYQHEVGLRWDKDRRCMMGEKTTVGETRLKTPDSMKKLINEWGYYISDEDLEKLWDLIFEEGME